MLIGLFFILNFSLYLIPVAYTLTPLHLLLFCVLLSPLLSIWLLLSKGFTAEERKVKRFILNFGPQHPASHGVLRLILQLQGELIEKGDSNIGFLHRGTEKLIEQRIFIKSLPYFDRLDYVSMMSQEHAFCLGVESLLTTQSFTALHIQIRTLFDELTRLLNHFLGISTHSLDVGNMSPVFWAFEEREKIMEFYERVSGARMHAAFYRPNDLDLAGVNSKLFSDIMYFCANTTKIIIEIFTVLATNKIWKTRLVGVGIVSNKDATLFGATGVVARSAGIKKDMRLFQNTTYSYYWFINISSFLGSAGDSFDRFLIRVREMLESSEIADKLALRLFYLFSDRMVVLKARTSFYSFFSNVLRYQVLKYSTQGKNSSMEYLIEHFKYYSEGIRVPAGLVYRGVEAPKGEFGVSIVSKNDTKPLRCKIRTPAYHHLQLMSKLIKGHFFVDMITILGSMDIVFGEVDR